MRVIQYNNRSCLDLKDKDGEVTPIQLLIVGASGHGKGTASESIAERWKKTTGGVVIFLNDPKLEAEQSFVQYEPESKSHLNSLRTDGIKKGKYKAELYHPYTHNLSKKGYLPPMNLYTLSIKDMTKNDWSVLAESDSESESIKLLERVSRYIDRNASLFDFLLEIERLTEGKKDKKKAVRDPRNWGLKSGGGTAKDVRQIGNMLSAFEQNYFLRKDTCPYKLDWSKILLNPEPYHVFLTNWIDNPKLRKFLVEALMGQAINEAQRLHNLGKLKKPVLFMIPELIDVCAEDDKGVSQFIGRALRKHLVTMRSKAGGMSCISDTQIWSQTQSSARGGFNHTFYGRLNPEDARVIFKANSYGSTVRELFDDIEENPGSFIWYKHESFGVFNIFMPSHMHKEVKYNWVQMYKKHFRDKMIRYDDVVKFMKKEFEQEQKIISELEEKEKLELEIEEEKKELRKQSKETKTEEIEVKQKPKDKAKEYLMKRAWELNQEGKSDREIAKEIGLGSHKTAKKYYLKYKEILDKEEKEKDNPDRILPFLGAGVMPEEVEANFGDSLEAE